MTLNHFVALATWELHFSVCSVAELPHEGPEVTKTVPCFSSLGIA